MNRKLTHVFRGIAVALALASAPAFADDPIKIGFVVKQPEEEHKVRMRDFEAWLESNGRSPAEMGW